MEHFIPVSDITWVSGELGRLYSKVMRLVRNSSGKLYFHDALIASSCRELDVSVLTSFDRDFDELDWLTRVERPVQITEALSKS